MCQCAILMACTNGCTFLSSTVECVVHAMQLEASLCHNLISERSAYETMETQYRHLHREMDNTDMSTGMQGDQNEHHSIVWNNGLLVNQNNHKMNEFLTG